VKAGRNNGIHVKPNAASKDWRVLDCTAGRAELVSAFATQRAAHIHACGLAWLKVFGYRVLKGCEVVIHRTTGRIRRKDSFGRDPRKTKG
jgi:hypothetical protein